MKKKGKYRCSVDAMGPIDANPITSEFTRSSKPIVTVDVEKYQFMLDGSGLNDEEKQVFLQSLWSIIVTFVDLGFGVHPLQEVCGQDSVQIDQRPTDAFNDVASTQPDNTSKGHSSSPTGKPEVE